MAVNKKTKKILLVTPSYEPIVGGAEIFVRKLASNLNSLGIQADVLTLNMNKKWKPFIQSNKQKNQFIIYRIGAIPNPLAFLPINPLHKILRFNVIPTISFSKLIKKYDIIHFCDEEDLSFPLFCYFIKKPKIMHLLTPIGFQAIKENFFQKRVFRSIASLYIPDAFQIPLLIKIGIPQIKILDLQTIGVDISTFCPNETKRLGSLVLYVGRLQKLKGIHVLLKSLESLKTPVHLVIIGPFDPSDKEYSMKITNTVTQINNQGLHQVELKGSLGELELVNWYQRATLLVTPHLDGSAGLTTLEALSCATPVIATSKLTVQNGVTGLLIPPNDPEKLKEALNILLNDPELRRKLGKRGREQVEKSHSWKKIASDIIGVYERYF